MSKSASHPRSTCLTPCSPMMLSPHIQSRPMNINSVPRASALTTSAARSGPRFAPARSGWPRSRPPAARRGCSPRRLPPPLPRPRGLAPAPRPAVPDPIDPHRRSPLRLRLWVDPLRETPPEYRVREAHVRPDAAVEGVVRGRDVVVAPAQLSRVSCSYSIPMGDGNSYQSFCAGFCLASSSSLSGSKTQSANALGRLDISFLIWDSRVLNTGTSSSSSFQKFSR